MHCSPCWDARLENIGSLLLNNYIRAAEERQQEGGAPPPPLLRSSLGWQALGLASVASSSRPQGNSCCAVVLPPSMHTVSATGPDVSVSSRP